MLTGLIPIGLYVIMTVGIILGMVYNTIMIIATSSSDPDKMMAHIAMLEYIAGKSLEDQRK